MQVREMNVKDLDTIVHIEKDLFMTPWKTTDFLYEMKINDFGRCYVLEDKDIIGYICMWFAYEYATITNIGISKDYQGQGLSKLLMNHGLLEAKKAGCETCSLEVRVSNIKAKSLYESYGFIVKTLRKGYYTDNDEDAYLMVKERMDDVWQPF